MIISVKEVKKYICCVLMPLLFGLLSNMLSELICGVDMATYYHELIKPGFAPPGMIFPIMWTILFILMGTSSYIILSDKKNQGKVRDAIFFYLFQLILNFLWSIFFFGFQLRLTALIDLILLFGIVLVMIYKFYKIKPIAAYLNIPYALWLVYAFILNYFIWFINR